MLPGTRIVWTYNGGPGTVTRVSSPTTVYIKLDNCTHGELVDVSELTLA